MIRFARAAHRAALFVSVAAAALGAAPALAQMAPAVQPATETVVVPGQRLRQERAIDARRTSTAILDAVTADEMGRVADKNVAESIERLPGVSLKYDQGEGRFVSLRGIDGALNNVTVNGVDLGSPEGDTRQLPLDVVGGQFLSRVEVIKAITPDMDGQAIGGNVNLVLQSPYDFGQDAFLRLSLQGGEHELNGTIPFALETAAGFVFGGNDQFGLMLGASYQERDFRSYGLYPDDWGPVAGSRRGAPINIKFTTYDIRRARTGLSLAAEWRPQEGSRVYLQGLYSLFTEDEYRQRYRLDFGALRFNPDGTTATFSGGERRQDLRLEQKDKSLLNLTLGGEHRFGAWKADGLLAWGLNELDEPNEVWLFRSGGQPGGAISGAVDFGPLLYSVTPTVDAPPSALEFRQLTIQQNKAEETILTAALNLQRSIGWGDEGSFVKVGLRLRDAEKIQDNNQPRYDRGTTANRFTLASAGLAGRPTATRLDGRTYPNPVTIDAGLMRAFTDGALGSPRIVFNPTVTASAAIGSDWTVEERVSAAYAMASLEFGKWTVLGGLRAEHTETSVATKLPTAGGLANDGSYTSWLPGLHVRYETDNDVVARLAVTRTLGRPAYGQLTPAASINVQPATPVISRGDPSLEPYLSTNIDLAADWYFARGGVLGVGIFHKDISDYIFTATERARNVTFQGVTYPEVVLSQPANASSATVTGLELNYQQQFRFLPAPFDGFGVGATVTLTDSEVDVPGRGKLALPRQSDLVWGLQLFYQGYGFEGSISYQDTSEYLDTVAATQQFDTYFNQFRRLGAKLSYAIAPNAAVFIEGQNLNDEVLWEYQGARPDWQIGYERYGRTLYLGVTASF